MLKAILNKGFGGLLFFYKHLGNRIIVMLFFSILVALMDGFGMTMFLPLFEMISSDGASAEGSSLGKMEFLVNFVEGIGLTLNLEVILCVMLFFFSLKGVFTWLEQYVRVHYQTQFISNIRIQVLSGLSNHPYSSFAQMNAGMVQNTVTAEIGRLSDAYRAYMRMLQFTFIVLTYCLLAFISDPMFSLLVLVGGGISNILFFRFYRKTKKLSQSFTELNNRFQSLSIQLVSYFKYLKATGLTKKYNKQLFQKVVDIEQTVRKIGLIAGIMQGAREPLMIFVIVVVILVKVNLLGGTLALILLSLMFFYRALIGLSQVQSLYNTYLSFSGSLEHVQKFSENLERDKESEGTESFEHFEREILVENLQYSYGQTRVLHDINLHIPKNQTLAIVGDSGSGKTTLMNLLCGLLSPEKGNIKIDGQDISSLKKEDLRKQIGYITQESVIFDDDLFNNVTFWDERSKENIIRYENSIKMARLSELAASKQGMDGNNLGSQGVLLSGGQRQRISIARELYKEVDFLFMDEATASLDSITEKEIQENIEQLQGHYTMVIVAHRLSTIKHADKIILMREGKLVQSGDFKSLYQKSEVFKELVDIQFKEH